jgi:hypothetical protein
LLQEEAKKKERREKQEKENAATDFLHRQNERLLAQVHQD